jgi:hypothetical protein
MRQRQQQEGIGDDGDDTKGNSGKEVYLKNPRVQLILYSAILIDDSFAYQ